MEPRTLEISWGSLWRIAFFALFVLIVFFGRQVLLAVFLAIVISSGLETVVNFLERRKIPRTLGVIVIFILALLVVAAVIYTLVPRVIVELNAVFTSISRTADNISFSPLIDFEATKSFGDFAKRLSVEFFSGSLSPLSLLSRALGGFSLAIAVLVSSFYLALNRDGVERFLRAVLPSYYEAQGLRIYERSRKKIGAWFQTQILLSVIMGFLTWGALALLGVKHAFLLGVFAGILELMPIVGPIISGAIAVVVALSSSLVLALYVLAVFLGIHQFESHVLVPTLTKKAVGLHPVLVIAAILIGANIWGLLGILVAVPAAAVFDEVVNEWSSAKKKPAT